MTGPSPAFQLGQEVEIIGPDSIGAIDDRGTIFKISMLWDHKKGMLWSNDDLPWYPASSLRLVEDRPLSPMNVSYEYPPEDYMHGHFDVSCPCGRKARIEPPVEEPELKIGDWVQVVLTENPYTGKIGKVSSIGLKLIALNNMGLWSKESLRKLTPEEVAKHTGKDIGEFKATLKLDTSEFEAVIDKMQDKLWKLQVEQRLAAIEKRLDVKAPIFAMEASQKAATESPLDGEKRTWTRREAARLSILREIAAHVHYWIEGDLVNGSLQYPLKKLEELDRIEKQIAEGQ